MTPRVQGSLGAQLKALREAAGFTQEELASIAALSVHAISALERGERRRPHVETVRALSAALDLTGAVRDKFVASARATADTKAADELSGVSLPLALTRLLGREAEVRTLRDWFADPTVRLVTLTGPGGVGKTRVALEVAHLVATEGVARVGFVPLAAVREPSLVAPAITEAVGLADVQPLELSKRLRSAFGSRPTLLVLDNFEQVAEVAPLLVDLLSSVASLRLLTTSRAALHVRGEREYVLGPLPLNLDPDAMSPADFARSPAVQLFVERVRDVQPSFRLTAANASTVAAICRRLDALPLALELAAPWMKVLTAADLLERLGRDDLDSTAAPRDLPERQRTMNATVAWSYQLLAPDEQRAFRRFGVLPGPFRIDAAAAVLAGREASARDGEALRATTRLIDRSLLVRTAASVVTTTPRYEMLETVRAYAAQQLAGSGERDDAMDGLVRFCTREAALAAVGLVGPSQMEWLERVRLDLESYRRVLAWLAERDRAAEAVEISWGLLFFWLIRGHTAEGLRWYEQALHLPTVEPPAEARALLGAAIMRYTQGELAQTRTWLTRARTTALGIGSTEIVAQAESMLGHLEHAAGNTEAALEWFRRSYDGFQAAGIAWGAGQALTGMARVTLAAGDADEAERLADRAASVLRDVGPWFLALTRNMRALVAVRRGKPDEALGWTRACLLQLREFHDRFMFVYALVPLIAAAVLKGDAAWVARIVGVRDAVTESTGAMAVDHSTKDLLQQAEAAARVRLGADRWALAYAAGRTSSIDSLLQEIDAVLLGPGSDKTAARADDPREEAGCIR